MPKLRIIIGLAFLALASFIAWRTYAYFFSQGVPSVEIMAIEPDGSYCGDASCVIKGADDYKVSTLSIAIDGKPLITNHKIGKKKFEYTFSIPTKALSNGKHILTVDIQNGAFNKNNAKQEIGFNVDNNPLQAAFVKGETDAKVFQGRTLHVQFQANKEIKEAKAHALSKTYNFWPESPHSLIYEAFIPIECETIPNEYLLTVEIADKVGNTLNLESKFQVIMYPFKKQTIKIDPEKFKLENETGLPEKQLETELEELSRKSPNEKLWHGLFYTPVEIRDPKQITTEFGVIRTTQERGLRKHNAIDVYNTPKSVVWASQDGTVVIKNRYAHSGNTVVIDHGGGMLSLFYHLDSFAPIQVGEKIKKGSPIGTIGKTGYATGYHLHWEMRINNIQVDPLQWTKAGF